MTEESLEEGKELLCRIKHEKKVLEEAEQYLYEQSDPSAPAQAEFEVETRQDFYLCITSDDHTLTFELVKALQTIQKARIKKLEKQFKNL